MLWYQLYLDVLVYISMPCQGYILTHPWALAMILLCIVHRWDEMVCNEFGHVRVVCYYMNVAR